MRSIKLVTALLSIIMMILAAFLLTGCWDRLEPDVLGIATVIGFDLDSESGLYKMYVQFANPLGGGRQQQNGGGGQSKAPIWVTEAEGDTIYEAFKNLELISTRRLLLSDLKVILFSEKLARKGIAPVLDFIDREQQTRLIARTFVVQGDLRRLLEAEYPMEQEGGEALSKHFFSVSRETSFIPEIDSIRELLRHLSLPGLEASLPRVIVLEDDSDNKKPAGKLNPGRISGSAVFRGDKLVGFLEEKETAGYRWLKGKVRRHYLILKCPGDEEKLITVAVSESSTKLIPEINGDEVRFKALITAKGNIQDYTCFDLPSDKEFLDSLNRRMAAVIRNEIIAGLEKARELEADILGLGNIIYRTRNKDWKILEDKWQDVFPNVKVDIEVKAVVTRHGHVSKPVQIR